MSHYNTDGVFYITYGVPRVVVVREIEGHFMDFIPVKTRYSC